MMNQINLLYIGNKLSKHSSNATSIETLGSLLELEGFQLAYASSKKNKILRLLNMIFATLKVGKKSKFVLIDVYSTYNFWYAFIISQLCRILKIKYIPKLHGGNLPQRFRNNPRLCKMIFQNAHLNIVPSNYLMSALENFQISNCMYVPNTIEIENYKLKERKIFEPKLLWVRSFDKIYNPIMAVKVLVELKKTYPKAQLTMVGPEKDGSLEKTKLFSEQNNVNVNFTGKLSKEEWAKLSEKHDIFINTTHFDNTPISVIEAMALGLPVISTNVGGIPYLLEHEFNAVLVNDNDYQAMVMAVKKIIETPIFAVQLSKNARLMTEKFDWKIVKKLWIKILS